MRESALHTMEPFAAEAIRLALLKMFRVGGYFDICTVDKCIKLAQVSPPRCDYDALSVLHCVHWNEMTQAMREEVVRRTLGVLLLPECDVAELRQLFFPDPVRVVEVPAQTQPRRPGMVMRLLGRGGEA